MDGMTWMKRIRMIDKMKEDPVLSRKLGLKDRSYIKGKRRDRYVNIDLYHLHVCSIREDRIICIKRSLGADKDILHTDLPAADPDRDGI